MKVLYVEDDTIFVTLANMTIKQRRPDIALVTAEDYLTAVKQLQTDGPFDLIVSDYQYPDGEGDLRAGGRKFLDLVSKSQPETPFVYFSSTPVNDVLRQTKGQIDIQHIFDKNIRITDVIGSAEKIFPALRRPENITTTTAFAAPKL